jgi:ribosomal protein S12 methylthiotransferase
LITPAKFLKIRLLTLGCAKNTVDSEVLAGMLLKAGAVLTEKEEADAVIINTCGFIQDAKLESIEAILGQTKLKEEGKIGKVIVMGCLAGRYMDSLPNEIPEADAFMQPCDYAAVLKSLGLKNVAADFSARVLSGYQHSAYLKISEGCDRQCSFCAIPMIRGKHVSRPQSEIMIEFESLVSRGVKEVNVIAQDTSWYGMDLFGERKLDLLLSEMAETGFDGWIRLHYAYPAGFPEKLAEVIARYPNICKYVDLPLQHISPRILKSMKRGITDVQTYKLLDMLRSKIPGLHIRTTLITGYPGESREEYKMLKEFIIRQEFDRLGVFAYSEEEGTPAARLKDDVSVAVKSSRLNELMEIQREISLKKNSEIIGRIVKVLIDSENEGFFVGRTEFDSQEIDNEVIIEKQTAGLKTGDFAEVEILSAGAYDLFA